MRVILPMLVVLAAGSGAGYLTLTSDGLANTFTIYSSLGKLAIMCSAIAGVGLLWLVWNLIRSKGPAPRKTVAEAEKSTDASRSKSGTVSNVNPSSDSRPLTPRPFEHPAVSEPALSQPKPAVAPAADNDLVSRHEQADDLKRQGSQEKDVQKLEDAAALFTDLISESEKSGSANILPVFLSKRGQAFLIMAQLSEDGDESVLDRAIADLTEAANNSLLAERESLFANVQLWLGTALLKKARSASDPAAAEKAAERFSQAIELARGREHPQFLCNLLHNQARALLLIGQITSESNVLQQAIDVFEQAIKIRSQLDKPQQLASSRELQAIATRKLAETNGSAPELLDLAKARMQEAASIYVQSGDDAALSRSERFLESLGSS